MQGTLTVLAVWSLQMGVQLLVAIANLRKDYIDGGGFARATLETTHVDIAFSQRLFRDRFLPRPLHTYEIDLWPAATEPSEDVRELWELLGERFPRNWRESCRAQLLPQLQSTRDRHGAFTGGSLSVESRVCPSFPSYRAQQLVSSNYVVSIALTFDSNRLLLVVGRVHASMKPNIIYPCILGINTDTRTLYKAECACPTGYTACSLSLTPVTDC